jgi:hypothetical protein
MTEPRDNAPDPERERESQSEPALARPHRNSDGRMGVLAVRLLDDVVRIVEAEVKLVEVNFGSALTASLDRAVGRFLAALLLFLGASCLLAGLIMLLRHWLEMWQALAVAGAAAFAAAFTVAWIAGRIASSAESQLTKS